MFSFVFFCVNFALFLEVCDTGAWLCRENDDAYLLHFLNIDCKPNTSQSEKALTVSLFVVFLNVIQGPLLCVTALMCTTTLS